MNYKIYVDGLSKLERKLLELLLEGNVLDFLVLRTSDTYFPFNQTYLISTDYNSREDFIEVSFPEFVQDYLSRFPKMRKSDCDMIVDLCNDSENGCFALDLMLYMNPEEFLNEIYSILYKLNYKIVPVIEYYNKFKYMYYLIEYMTNDSRKSI